MTESTPVLVLAYMRPEMTMRLLRRLVGSGISRIYVSIDGPKNDSDAGKQATLIEDIDEFLSSHKVNWKIQYSPDNLGVRNGVLAGLDWFFNQEESGIVLEDDLEFSQDFLNYCAHYLSDLDKFDDIWMISGMQVLDDHPGDYSHILSSYPMIWGWATTSKKWREIRTATSRQELLSPWKFGSQRSYFWNRGYSLVQSGKLDTWDLPLVLAFLSNKKFCLISCSNLVKNIGFDVNASHTAKLIFPLNHPIQSLGHSTHVNVNELHYSKSYDALLEKKVFKFTRRQILFGYPYFFLTRLRFSKSSKSFKP